MHAFRQEVISRSPVSVEVEPASKKLREEECRRPERNKPDHAEQKLMYPAPLVHCEDPHVERQKASFYEPQDQRKH